MAVINDEAESLDEARTALAVRTAKTSWPAHIVHAQQSDVDHLQAMASNEQQIDRAHNAGMNG
jgi:hypothetical protein